MPFAPLKAFCSYIQQKKYFCASPCDNRTDASFSFFLESGTHLCRLVRVYICMLICLDGLLENWKKIGTLKGIIAVITTCTVDEDRLAYIRPSVHTVDLEK